MIRKLWVRFLLLYLAVVFLAICIASVYAHYRLRSYFVDRLEEDLFRTARTLAVLLDVGGTERPFDAICRQLKDRSGYRVTLIDDRGIVLGDSDRDSSSMENHLYRPEVQEALENGSGSAIRYSHTMSYPMLYGAIQVSSGTPPYFLRLSLPLEGVFARLAAIRSSIVQGSLVAFFAALPVLFFLSRRLSRRIERVTNFVQAARKGDLSRRLYIGSRDELGVLEKELDEVAEELNDQVAELTSHRRRLGTILEAIQDGIILLDAQDRILFINPYACEIIGRKDGPKVGMRLMEVMRSDELYTLVRRAREEERPPAPMEVLFVRNPERTFLARARNLRDVAPAASGACLILLRDVSERKRLERIRADFLFRVSHELRTPLTLIKGFAETLQDEGFQDSEEANRYLSVIGENTDRLTRLVGDLVRLSSIELGRHPVRLEAVPLKERVHKAVQSFEVRAREKGIALVLEIPEGLPPVLADPDRLTEILFNLLDNAMKFTTDGQIRLSAERRPAFEQAEEAPGRGDSESKDDNRPQFLYVPSGANPLGCVALMVEDTGHGIPVEELPRVTERFFQGERKTQDREKGSGLGLAIVKHLVKLMGGRLSIQSQESRGTTVKVMLPVAPEEDGSADETEDT
jgi:two-component system phosphate regulon sensor histidine kinase PhoR